MNYRILFFCVLLFLSYKIHSQSTIPIDIVKLSKLTFSKNPTIKRNALTINRAEGRLQIQKSVFDYQLVSSVSLSRNTLNLFEADARNGFLGGNLKSKNTGATIGLQRKLRSGLTASLSVDYSMMNDNLPYNRFSQNVGAYIQDHSVSSRFSLTKPLLRGNTRKVTTALERASLFSLESTRKNTEFTNSFELFQTGNAYWKYVAAYKNLKIYKENEARVKRVLEITQELVKADKKPAGDLLQIQADLAKQERQTNVAKQTLFSAKLNLGRAVGLSEKESKKIGIPLDEFPSIVASGYTKSIEISELLKTAQDNRKDIEASKRSQESLELKLDLANNNRKPQLDITGFINYGGMSMGNGIDKALSSFTNKEGGNLGFGFSLNFSFALNNNHARGSYLQNEASLKDQQISNNNLQRNINLNVSIALNSLDNSVLVLEKSLESLNFYQEVYNNEQVKFQNGLTTLLNLILFQERLTFSQLEYLQAHQQFASAIINLRYETGTLLIQQNKNEVLDITKELFYTVPK